MSTSGLSIKCSVMKVVFTMRAKNYFVWSQVFCLFRVWSMSTISSPSERETSLGTLSILSDELLIFILGTLFATNMTSKFTSSFLFYTIQKLMIRPSKLPPFENAQNYLHFVFNFGRRAQ
jgi:hypothetical protein